MSAFIFDNKSQAMAVHLAEIPAGIQSKAELLDVLSDTLRFPDYFGRNWDALDECICDLSWLPEGDVILNHDDLPLSNDLALLSIYLAILKKAVEEWNAANGKRKLFIMFPPDTEDILIKKFPSSLYPPR